MPATLFVLAFVGGKLSKLSDLWGPPQPFGEWNRVFPDPAMTLAAVDRLVHHATIFEMNVESYRRRSAMEAKRSRGRPATFATISNSPQIDAPRQSAETTNLVSDNQADTIPDAAT